MDDHKEMFASMERWVKATGRKYAWLADDIGVSYWPLYNALKGNTKPDATVLNIVTAYYEAHKAEIEAV